MIIAGEENGKRSFWVTLEKKLIMWPWEERDHKGLRETQQEFRIGTKNKNKANKDIRKVGTQFSMGDTMMEAAVKIGLRRF